MTLAAHPRYATSRASLHAADGAARADVNPPYFQTEMLPFLDEFLALLVQSLIGRHRTRGGLSIAFIDVRFR